MDPKEAAPEATVAAVAAPMESSLEGRLFLMDFLSIERCTPGAAVGLFPHHIHRGHKGFLRWL
jgi:hypothetical protein